MTHAKFHIVIPIEREMVTSLRNRFPFALTLVDDVEEDIQTNCCWRKKVACFRYCLSGRSLLIIGQSSWFLVHRSLNEFDFPVFVVLSCIVPVF